MASTNHYEEGRPMSVKELSDKAKEYEWNPNIGFKYWARAAETIHHEGQVYLREDNLAHAYVVLMRYSMLVLDNLRSHPEIKTPEARRAMRPLVERVPIVLETLEDMRPRIDKSYQEWVKITAAERDTPRERRRSSSSYARHAAKDAALSWSHASPAKILDAAENQELAVDLAKKEMHRRRRLAGLSDEEVSRRRAAGVWDGALASRYMDDEELRKQMEATRRQLDRTEDHTRDDDFRNRRTETEPSTSYYYPSINRSAPLRYDSQRPPPRREDVRIQPPRPPKESFDRRSVVDRPPPPLPDKHLPAYDTPPEYSSLEYSSPTREEMPPLPPKHSEGTAKQKRITFRPAAYLESGEPIRPVFLPSLLRQRFLEIASDNTRRGLEMCGILCGTPVNNALFVSCLLIPEQKCTSDTCETENENAMLDYCITNDLLVIGWIHTHPTQTCFMSSRDLHTQAGYQVMMPESIAIVCSPRHEPSWGIFRLTNPPGLPHILSCQHSDTFHQHSIDNIYTDAGQPGGHVYESRSLEFDVHDLRPKR